MFKKFLLLFLIYISVTSFALKINLRLSKAEENKPSLVLGLQDDQSEEYLQRADETFVFSALPSFDEQVKTQIKTADARPEIIRQYLHKFNSPLEPYSNLIVALSDQYQFDYRWLVAIAQQESNLCKRIPENSYNCWGWGIYPDPKNPEVLKVTRFDNFEDALRRIAPQFTKIFLKGKHYRDPAEVMKTYTPPSDGSWAEGVSLFFEHLE